MLPSLEWRFSLGRFLTPVLLGYGRAKARIATVAGKKCWKLTWVALAPLDTVAK